MRIFGVVSLAIALSTLSCHATPLPQDPHPVDTYIPLNTYQAFESPPPEGTLLHLSTALNTRPADLYFLSVFYTYDTLSDAEKADLAALRALNATIDEEVKLCLFAPIDCFPLWINGHRREDNPAWTAIRESGEADYDQRMEYVAKGRAVAVHWARIVKAMQKEWRGREG